MDCSDNVLLLCRGLTPADCELSFLRIAKELENYGVDLHTVEVSNFSNNANVCSRTTKIIISVVRYLTCFSRSIVCAVQQSSVFCVLGRVDFFATPLLIAGSLDSSSFTKNTECA